MPLPVTIDFTALRESDSTMYHKAVKIFKHENGAHEVDVEKLEYWEDRKRLSDFIEDQQKKAAAAAQVAEAERQRAADAEAAAQQKKIDADLAAYMARLAQYVHEEGLQPTAANAEAITTWLEQHPNIRGYKSAGNVDAAISILRSKLSWKPKAQSAPAPVIAEAEPVVLLSDGKPRLSLNTVPGFEHSLLQLRDLAKRQQAAAPKSNHGWHGSKL